tara:strand:+ start:214 stop:1053 length:840 start_codon:yes stop_codon:yes gene_type:complete
MSKFFVIFFIILSSCTDLLTNKSEYNSINLQGDGWVQVNQGTNFNTNNFTLQTWISGSDTTINNSQTILSVLSSSGEILIGIFKDPTYQKRLDIWIDNQNVNTVEVSENLSNLDSFNLVTLTGSISESNPSFISISIFINKTKVFNQSTTLTTDDLANTNFVIGGKVNTEQTYRDSFWHGCIDEIRLWNIALADSIINYHNEYPTKLSFESDSPTYDGYLGQLIGLWRLYTEESTYSTIPNEACATIEKLYNDNPCSTNSEAIIYTLGNNTIEFSEKHK